MTTKEHSFAHAYPEMNERIHQLKAKDSHFAGLLDKYDILEHSIHRLESGEESFTDEQLEKLKKQRLSMKDELVHILKKAA